MTDSEHQDGKFRGEKMRHFSLESWADFARNVIGEDQKAAMQSHLETGCKQCSGVLGLWQRLQQLARLERTCQPPDSAVRSVKGIYSIYGVHRGRRVKPTIAQLLFDSFRNPLLAGVRATAADSRQLLYGAGDYRVDVRIAPLEDSEKVSLVGQVLNSAEPWKPCEEAPVALFKGRKIRAESKTNRFGEFHLEFDLAGRYHLRVMLPSHTDVRIPLVEHSSQELARSLHLTESSGVKPDLPRTKMSTRKKV